MKYSVIQHKHHTDINVFVVQKREGKWTSDSPPPRELLWILARQNENGEYKTDEIGEVAAQIVR